MWEADAAWLRLLAAVPAARVRPVGDGFAVRTGGASNDLNGVVCDHLGGEDPRDVLAWLDGAPARWLCGPDADVHAALAATGARPERTAVAMGAPVGALDLRGDAGAVAVRDRTALEAWIRVAVACEWWEDEADAALELRAALALGDDAPVHLALSPRGAIAAWMVLGRTVVVLDLAVRPDARRQGLGRAMLGHVVARLPAADALVLGPTPDAIPFYERLGLVLAPYPRDRAYHLPAAPAAGGP
jgi:GNAT superfamily N-acetyltransferase